MTHGGHNSLGKSYKLINQHVRRGSPVNLREMHATHTFVPLGAGSPVFGGSHHIINYADKFLQIVSVVPFRGR